MKKLCSYFKRFRFDCKLTRFFSVVLLLSLFFNCNAQTINATSSAHSLGFTAGTTTGVGPCYKYMPKQLRAQVTYDLAYPPYSPNTLKGYGGGITFFQRLTEHELLNLFCYESFFTKSYPLDRKYSPHQIRKYIINEGAGFGLELSDLYGFSLSAMMGNGNYGDFTKGVNHHYSYYYSNLGPTIEVALYYTFK